MIVLALMATYEISGPCRGLFQLADQAKHMGVRFVLGNFLVPSFSTCPAIENAKLRGFAVEVLRQNFRYDPWLILRALKAVREHRVEILQSHGYKPSLLSWCLKRLTGLPWIAFVHGYTTENQCIDAYNRLDRWLMRYADRVVVVSEATARVLQQAGTARDRIRVIYNAIDLLDYRLDAQGAGFRRQCGAGPAELLIGVIGRLSPEKGHAVFIQAFQKVAKAIPQARAVLVGEGQELEQLQASARAARLEGRITFAGYHTEISSVYAGLDLVVIPSLSEGLPNVLLEAMLHSKAVVATAVGGIPEVMQGALSKWVVPSGDVEALAQAIIDALRNSTVCAELGKIGELYVRKTFSPARRAEQIVRIYQEFFTKSATS